MSEDAIKLDVRALAEHWQEMADYLHNESKKGEEVEHQIAYAESKVYRHCAELLLTQPPLSLVPRHFKPDA